LIAEDDLHLKRMKIFDNCLRVHILKIAQIRNRVNSVPARSRHYLFPMSTGYAK
jgi:hypothetical protein